MRSYRTFSPLPFDSIAPCETSARRAVYFLCHFPSGRPARVLPGALPCGVRTFLSRQHFPSLRRWVTARQRSPGSLRRIFDVSAYPSVSCEIWYCSSFLYRLLRGVSITSAVFEMFQPFSLSLATRYARSEPDLNSCSVGACIHDCSDGAGADLAAVAGRHRQVAADHAALRDVARRRSNRRWS